MLQLQLLHQIRFQLDSNQFMNWYFQVARSCVCYYYYYYCYCYCYCYY